MESNLPGSASASSAAPPDKPLAVFWQPDASVRVAPFRLILMTLLALRLLGGDVAMLQVVAWTGMIVSRTAERGVAEAVKSTMDGDEPCPLCKAVKAVQQSEQTPQPASPDNLISKLKLNDLLRSEDQVIPGLGAAAGKTSRPDMDPAQRGLTRSDAPPVPPPRRMAA